METRTERIDALLQLLRLSPQTTAADLAERLGTSTRTIQRDLATLRDRGIAIESERGRGGGVRLAERFRMAPVPLTPDEAAGLWLSLAVARRVESLPWATGAERAMGRVLSSLPPARRRELRNLRQRLLVGPPAGAHLVAEAGPVHPSVLATFERAFSARREMSFGYVDARGRRSRRRVQPHGLVTQAPLWYVLAYDVDRAAPRSFRMDRMDRPTLLEARFVVRPLAEDFPEFVALCR